MSRVAHRNSEKHSFFPLKIGGDLKRVPRGLFEIQNGLKKIFVLKKNSHAECYGKG
jgi:hypothetical protein